MSSMVELRVLDGANVWYARPAVKLTLDAAWLVDLPEAEAAEVARPYLATARPGRPGSEQRARFAARLLAAATRRLATAAGVNRLAVRGIPGDGHGLVVVAFPWHRLGKATALGEAVGRLLDDRLRSPAAVGAAVRDAAEGERPSVPRPRIPVVAVTGTNGKTTVTRLLAHIATAAGHTAGWSNTDGIYVAGELVEAGDWSGFGGAGRVLREPRVTFAVLETARGGILLRGIGAAHNDVAVVTNVSADHLGLHGIHTLDQLAEVKASIVRITKPGGWVVLNADDPRVLAMRRLTRARPFVFGLDPDAPGLRAAVEDGGRAATVLDGSLVLYDRGDDPEELLAVRDVPLTLAGLSRHNTANALAGLAAALAIGLPREAVLEGLRTFLPDATLNPGRMNLWDAGGRVLAVDLAHNEDGLHALLDVCRGLVAPGADVRLVLGGVGDRTEELLRAIGEIGARRADRIVIGHKDRYLRDRSPEELGALLREGAAEVGVTDVPEFPTELSGLQAVYAESAPGDVCAVMCHAERDEIYAWLAEIGARALTPADVARLAHHS